MTSNWFVVVGFDYFFLSFGFYLSLPLYCITMEKSE